MARFQFHEGVTGTFRGDDPLLTEGGSLLAMELMRVLWGAVMVGSPAPSVAATYERMSHPKIGDAVTVVDAFYRKNADYKHKGTGYLLAKREEWACTNDEWAQYKAEDPDLEDEHRAVEEVAWYIQYGPHIDDVCRWSNCFVVALPRP